TALVEGLNGAAAGSTGNVTAKSLVDFTRRRTAELAKAANKVQVVNAEIVDGGRDIDMMTIVGGIQPSFSNVTIKFGSDGNMRLSDSQFKTLLEQKGIAGDCWPVQQLAKGIYCLQNMDSGKKGYIEVNGTGDDLTYEFD
ncbi:MAG: hypothetical protein ACXVB6_17630, partial [Mucilaginibacter sp.]